MRQSLARFSGSVSSIHAASSVDCITTIVGFKVFGTHNCVLSLKPHLRLEWRGQDGQDETEQSDHSASLGDSITSSTRIRFSVHTGSARWCLPEMVKRRFKKSFERWLRGFHKCEVPTGPEI